MAEHAETFVAICLSHNGGAMLYKFFFSIEELTKTVRELSPKTLISIFKLPQPPLCGVVDDAFIARCMSIIPDRIEYLILALEPTVYGQVSMIHDRVSDTHADLHEHLEDFRGDRVAAGIYPPWWSDAGDVVSAIVPDEDGVVRPGAY